MYKKWNLFIILTLLLSLVFTSPAQIVVAAVASATADFIFTSTPNPSNLGQEVTFSVSATGSDSTYPPFGYVNFMDNGNTIQTCESVPLNYPNGNPAGGNSAICSTTSLAVGMHTITAEFSSVLPFVYEDSILTLQNGQAVNDSIPLTITPTSLADAMITAAYQMQLTATYPDGSACKNCSWWYNQGELPDGIGFNSETGILQGTPTSVGTNNFTVHVDDLNGARGSQDYSLQVTKSKTIVDVEFASTFVGNTSPITLSATAHHPDPNFSPWPTGKISFSVSGVPVPSCSGVNAKLTNSWGDAECTSYIPIELSAGSYTIQADFTPDAISSDLYLGGSGIGTLQINSQPPARVSGLVFMDDNQNGVRDYMEISQGNWNVFLNQSCDDFLEGNVVTNPITGEFSFEPVSIEYTYCLFVDLSGYTGYVQTTSYNDLILIGDQYFEIGVYYPHITILPNSEELLIGSVGNNYEQSFQISGGTQPYIIETYTEGLLGLNFDLDTLTLAGIPTVGGFGQFRLNVVDAEGIAAEMTYGILIQAEGEFSLESSANPSNMGQEVTFTLSGSGSAVDPQFGTVPPYGIVSFYDGDIPIIGCEETILNINEDTFEIGNFPAICTTSSLSEGQHTIHAYFTYQEGLYSDAVKTLTQQVGIVEPLTIKPETLESAAYQTTYNLQLSAIGGNEPYIFSLISGALPSGISLSPTGLLSGFADSPATPGTYPITVQVMDAMGTMASRDYNFVLDKGVPEVTVNPATNIYWNYRFNISAEVTKHTSPTSAWALDGTVAFFIDDQLVPGCETVPMDNSYYSCSVFDSNLAVGTHTVRAEYTPTGWYVNYYTSGSASNSLTVRPRYFVIQGYLYGDINQNATKDSNESTIQENGWTINLDENCDGEVDYTTTTSYGGFSFSEIPSGGQCYRLTVIAEPGYQQTSVLEDFVLTGNIFVPIGFYYPTITFSPSEYVLPFGSVGVEYYQDFSASGGAVPYTFTVQENNFSSLPDGLTLSAEGVLSGTPTMAKTYYFAVQAEDANHATGIRNYSLEIEAIKTDGYFTFISSPNPSTLGEEVIFTVSAVGEEVSTFPVGLVTFLYDGTQIEGCSDLLLNILFDEYGNFLGIGDYPVICTTAALETGTHEISANYTDWTGKYNESTLVLTQQVEIVEPLAILPETLPDAVYGMPFSQLFTGVCAEGYSCGFINWRLKSGSLPSGIQFQPHGLLSGSPSETGSFTFTIEGYDVNDYDHPLGTRTYTLNVLKATPKVTFDKLITQFDYNTYTYKTFLYIYITHPNGSWTVDPAGSVSVSVDGSPVDVCTNLGPIPNMAYFYSCVTTDELVGLMPGIHTLHADFTPDENAAPNFNSASGETTFTNPPRIEGLQFNDLDRDGVRDDSEESGYFGYIYFDNGCDGTNDYGTPADNSGLFSLNITPGEYCVNVHAYGKWYQSTILVPFTIDEETYKYFEIGFYESQLTYDPAELPSATVGKNYSQAITISAGVPPYSLVSVYQNLPGEFKFDVTFNESSVNISGTPTTYGDGYIFLELQDSTGMKGKWESSIVIKADGFFTLTSSSNPAAQGEEVTFTVSATGDVVYGDSPYPPTGAVTFYADGNPIEGCTEVFLNVDLDWNMGEFPAICKTTGLEIGSHTITATYLDWTGFYNDTTLALTQVVNAAVSADLSINKSDSKDPVKPGSKLLYTLTVNNLGEDLAESVIITDKLDVNTTYLSVSAPRGWKCSYIKNSGTVTCTSDSLASGSTAIIKINVLVNKTAKVGKELVNNAFVSSVTFDPDLTNNAVLQKTMVVK